MTDKTDAVKTSGESLAKGCLLDPFLFLMIFRANQHILEARPEGSRPATTGSANPKAAGRVLTEQCL